MGIGHSLTADSSEQDRNGFPADFRGRFFHGCQGNRKLSGDLNVAEPRNGNLLRDGDPPFPAAVENSYCYGVARRMDRCELSSALQQFSHRGKTRFFIGCPAENQFGIKCQTADFKPPPVSLEHLAGKRARTTADMDDFPVSQTE